MISLHGFYYRFGLLLLLIRFKKIQHRKQNEWYKNEVLYWNTISAKFEVRFVDLNVASLSRTKNFLNLLQARKEILVALLKSFLCKLLRRLVGYHFKVLINFLLNEH